MSLRELEKEPNEKKDIWNSATKTITTKKKLNRLEYSQICGEISVDSPSGEEEKKDTGKVFYTAYLTESHRPLIFFFNGGPGAASIWLHLGCFGPRIVQGLDVNTPDKVSLVDNHETLLHNADLVFVDPIGTGLSTNKEASFKDFCTEKADTSYLAQFITRFLKEHKLWGRRLFLCGESYGGFRVSLLSHLLLTKYDLPCEGLIFVAPFISLAANLESEPNIIGEANFLTAYALSAWYHKKSSLNQTCPDEKSTYKKARTFAFESYLPARILRHPHEIPTPILNTLSEMTGISIEVLKKEPLNIQTFCDHLFSGSKRYPGRIDSRYTLEHPFTMNPYIDASGVLIGNKLSPMMNAFLFNEVGWDSKDFYVGLSMKVNNAWRMENPFSESAFDALRAVMKLQSHMKIYAAGGYYDLAVPLSSIEYDLMQVADTDSIKERIHIEAFIAGHMMYVHDESRKGLTKSILRYLLN